MTVVLCVKCSDALVMAADTQITDKERGMSYPGRKLHPLGEFGAWGGSGARSVLLDVEEVFNDDAEAIQASEEISRALQKRVMPILQYHYDHFIETIPGEPEAKAKPAAYVLAGGYTRGDPWIVEINPHGMVSRYEGIGFHAIGSGAPMAHQAGALLAHFQMMEREARYGVVTAVRVLDALSQTSPSVGGAIDIRVIHPDKVEHLDPKAIEKARQRVHRWSEMEQRALDDLF